MSDYAIEIVVQRFNIARFHIVDATDISPDAYGLIFAIGSLQSIVLESRHLHLSLPNSPFADEVYHKLQILNLN